MCGRYAASRDKAKLVVEFGIDSATDEVLPPDYNVAPSKRVYAVMDRLQGDRLRRELNVAKWGFVPPWAKSAAIGSRLINARVETVATKPAFRGALASRRCLLPADGYFEWYTPSGPGGHKPVKQPFFIRPADGSVLGMAGLYEFRRDPEVPEDDPASVLRTTTVITTKAEADLGRIHDRMPVCLEPDLWDEWLNPAAGPEVLGVLRPVSPGWLRADPVSSAVNNVRNNGPQLLQPVPPGT
ncbi:MAG: SOS response-associated peptidase [Candidatus Nanopelagicales bacterium]|nr:SOS response-associated peptidase [Candidatus Nanopelagicales bacterium]